MTLGTEDFIWRLKQHEEEIRRRASHWHVLFLLKTGSHKEFPLIHDTRKPLFKWRIGGRLIGYSVRTVSWVDSPQWGRWFDIGGKSFPFALHWFEYEGLIRRDSMPSLDDIRKANDEPGLDDDDVAEGEAELFCWYYEHTAEGKAEQNGCAEDIFVLGSWNDWDKDGYLGLDTVTAREIRYTFQSAPDNVLEQFGDLSRLPRWTDTLLYLAASEPGPDRRTDHPHLRVFPGYIKSGALEFADEGTAARLLGNPVVHPWLFLEPSNFAEATSRAFEVLRHIAQERSTVSDEEPTEPAGPKDYCFGWAGIAAALRRPNEESLQKSIKSMHKLHPSPIVFGGPGTPPRAERSKLIEWWNHLENRWQEVQQKKRNKEATVADSYQHGRDGTVVPGIKGHERRRRKRKN